jgi:hypothetical protein
MNRRINHWGSRAWIFRLCSLKQVYIKPLFMIFKERQQETTLGDKDLANVLNVTMSNSKFQMVMTYNPYGKNVAVDKLRAAFRGKDLELTPDKTYNEETWFEFHQLLAATLLGYRSNIRALTRSRPETRTACAEKAWLFALLLWRIAYSRIFSRHLEVIQNLLMMPSFDEAADVNRWFKTLSIGPAGPEAHTSTDTEAKAAEEDLNEDVDEVQHVGTESAANTFRRWIRVQVQHFAALKIVSNANSKHSERIGITLARVNPCQNRSVIPWEDTVRHLFPLLDHAEENELQSAEHVITLLKEMIEDWGLSKRYSECRSVLQAFFSDVKGENQSGDSTELNFGIHCEVILACLSAFTKFVKFGEHEDHDLSIRNAIVVCDTVYHCILLI